MVEAQAYKNTRGNRRKSGKLYGTYSYSVADYDRVSSASSTLLSKSGASVKVYYNNTTTTFNVPNSAGGLWRVFTFTTSGGLIASGNMSSASNSASVY